MYLSDNAYCKALQEGRYMQPPAQFKAVKKEFYLTVADEQELRRKLMQLRAELIRRTGITPQRDIEELSQIEQKIYSIEHQLAHTIILEKETNKEEREEDLFDEIYRVIAVINHSVATYCRRIINQLVHYANRTSKNRAHKAK